MDKRLAAPTVRGYRKLQADAFSIHSSVRRFIEYFAFFNDGFEKRITPRRLLCKLL